MCKCKMFFGLLLLAAGILFAMKDLGAAAWWGLSWYTVAFILFGIKKMGCCCCKDCQVEVKSKKKK